MTKKIKLEFVKEPGYETLVARTDGRWGAFQNTYAVWTSNRSVVESIRIVRLVELQSGYYYVVGTVDNNGTVTVNGTRCNMYGFGTSISRTEPATSTRIYHPGGLMSIEINASNAGDAAGVAVTISNEVPLFQAEGVAAQTPLYTVGDLVWSTRTAGTPDIGRYIATMPYAASVEAHVWGAGGSGAAGSDATNNWFGGSSSYAPPGGSGSPGLYNTTTFTVAAGDLLEVFVGSAGQPGTVLRGAPYDFGNTPGGAGGASRTSVGGVAAQSYNGGRGGQGGRLAFNQGGGYGALWTKAGGGTGGGGGGGASGVLVNDLPAIVAGGGGGGGGSGPTPDQFANGTQGTGDSNAAITKNATGQTPGDNRGENGKDVGPYNFGGGGGGGGGGYPGGQGGMSRADNDSQGFHYGYNPQGGTGFHGKCGGNYPAYPASTGAGTLYWDGNYGLGGAGGAGSVYTFSQVTLAGRGGVVGTSSKTEPSPGQSGTDGRVVLIIEPIGLSSVKVAGEWRQITEAFYKVGGTWKGISDISIKVNDQWKPIEGGGGVTPVLTKNPSDYGLNNRSYS